MKELCRLTKTIPGLQAAISLIMLNKNLLFSTLGSQITKDFVIKSKACNLLIYLNFDQATLNHILRCYD